MEQVVWMLWFFGIKISFCNLVLSIKPHCQPQFLCYGSILDVICLNLRRQIKRQHWTLELQLDCWKSLFSSCRLDFLWQIWWKFNSRCRESLSTLTWKRSNTTEKLLFVVFVLWLFATQKFANYRYLKSKLVAGYPHMRWHAFLPLGMGKRAKNHARCVVLRFVVFCYVLLCCVFVFL